jgi:polar amino acid transport system permease protein
MGIFSLSAMLVAASIAIAIIAASGENAVFIPGLLQGAWLTVQIAVVGCVLAVVAGVCWLGLHTLAWIF